MLTRYASPGLLLLAACASAPALPLELPNLETRVRHYAGTVLTGRQPDPAATDRIPTDDAFALRCRVTYLATMPEDVLDPLATRTRLVVGARRRPNSRRQPGGRERL